MRSPPWTAAALLAAREAVEVFVAVVPAAEADAKEKERKKKEKKMTSTGRNEWRKAEKAAGKGCEM